MQFYHDYIAVSDDNKHSKGVTAVKGQSVGFKQQCIRR